jgi:hypothetical protein
MILDNSKLIPNSSQREWLSAQAYVLERDGLLVSTSFLLLLGWNGVVGFDGRQALHQT